MANKAAFTPNEWRQVVGGVFMAGSPSRLPIRAAYGDY